MKEGDRDQEDNEREEGKMSNMAESWEAQEGVPQ